MREGSLNRPLSVWVRKKLTEENNQRYQTIADQIKQGNTDDAIIKSIELLDHKDFKNYNVIDLRVDGKIIVE